MRNDQESTRLWTVSVLVLTVAGLAFVLASVFSSDNAQATTNQTSAESQSAFQATPDGEVVNLEATTDAEPVAVTVSKGSVDVPGTVSSDSLTFKVMNEGQTAHSFAVGTTLMAQAETRIDGTLEAGQSETLTPDLNPGTYIAYCPVEGHQAEERAEFTVEK